MVMGDMVLETELLVIGSGPGGYSAAFRAADLGIEVTMVDPTLRPGGTCLFHGCIPSKTLLFLTELICDARRAVDLGVSFGEPQIDLGKLREWRDEVVNSMADGLAALCKRRGIGLFSGKAHFEDKKSVLLSNSSVRRITFGDVIIATGSSPIPLPGMSFSDNGRIMNSSGALALDEVPESLLVIGGGYIGLEIGLIYAGLGSSVTLVELQDRLLCGVDRDLLAPLERRLAESFDSIRLSTRVSDLQEIEDGITVTLETDGESVAARADKALVAIGRTPYTDGLGLESTEIARGVNGEIVVNEQQRTTQPHIYAVGDVAGGVMLAHKATREAKVAAEAIAGHPSVFDVRAIPAVVYTDPQIAWCGLTEEQALKEDIPVTIKKYLWKYSGRAATMGAIDGVTKMLVDPESGRVMGLGITGRHAEELIAEGVLAIEMGALAEDLALCLHPHPTLSETVGEAAERFPRSSAHVLAEKD